MPIGNQEIWDKGIGAGATNVIFGGGDTQPSATNFNPGALGADPNAVPVDPGDVTETTTSPSGEPTPEPTPVNPNQSKIHELNKRILMLQRKLADVNSRQPGGSTAQSYQRMITDAQMRLRELQYNGGL